MAGTYSGGDGSIENPYLISDSNDMQEIGANSDDWDKHFVMTADIDLSEYTGTAFNIIGNLETKFTGSFDGNGHRISNFSCTYTDRDYVGLFGYIRGSGAQIRNLGLVDPNVNAGEGSFVGSLVGELYGEISACFARGGSVSGGSTVGGLVGKNSAGKIYHCYCTTTVVGNSFLGGLVGDGNYGYIYKCYSTGSVPYPASTTTGGLLGMVGSSTVACFWDTETSGQTHSPGGTGKTTAEMQDPNTFMGAGWDFINAPDGPHDIWAEPVGGGYPVLWWEVPPEFGLPSFSGGTGQADDPYLISTATQLNRIGHNPRLMQCHFKLINNIDLAGVDFSIIGGDDFYSTYNSYELYPFGGVFDGGYSDISNFTYTSEDRKNVGLFGCIDGMNAQVRNLGLNDPMVVAGSWYYAGTLAGNLKRGTISNSFVRNGSVSGSSHVGGLVGYNENGGVISYCDTYAGASGDSRIGGLVGTNFGTVTFSSSVSNNIVALLYGGGLVGSNYGTISNCRSFANVSDGVDLGGLVGSNCSIISNCGSEGSVTSYVINDYIDIGGLTGYNSGSISASYSSASLLGFESACRAGGLIGANTGQVTDCYSLGSVEVGYYLGGLIGVNTGPVSNCYSACTVTALTGNDAGGLLGYNNSTITTSFWDVDTSTQTQMCGFQGTSGTGCDAGNGKTTIQMQTESTFTSAGWDFVGETDNGTDDIWRMCVDGVEYPKLYWQYILGDFICPDGVNYVDFAFFGLRWLDDECAGSNDCDGADLDTSGVVGIGDAVILTEHWMEGL